MKDELGRWVCIACVPVKEDPSWPADYNAKVRTYIPPAGAIRHECDKCKRLVWLGPKSQERRQQEKDKGNFLEAVCMECLAEEEKKAREEGRPASEVGILNPSRRIETN